MDAIFDQNRALGHKKRALAQTGRHGDFLMRAASAELTERLSTVSRDFDQAVVLHGVIDEAARAVALTGKAGAIRRIEADPALLEGMSGEVSPVDHLATRPESADLAVSLYALGEVDDVPGTLVQIRRMLRPDGFIRSNSGYFL